MSGRIDLTISAERGEHGEAYQGSGSSVNSDNRDGFQLSHPGPGHLHAVLWQTRREPEGSHGVTSDFVALTAECCFDPFSSV